MIATVTNLSSTDAVSLPHPFYGSIAASGNKTFALSETDLDKGDPEGNPSWKVIQDMVKKGKITVTFAADADDVNVNDDANEAA